MRPAYQLTVSNAYHSLRQRDVGDLDGRYAMNVLTYVDAICAIPHRALDRRLFLASKLTDPTLQGYPSVS